MRELVIKDIYLVVTIIKCLIIGVATSPGYTVTLKKAYTVNATHLFFAPIFHEPISKDDIEKVWDL